MAVGLISEFRKRRVIPDEKSQSLGACKEISARKVFVPYSVDCFMPAFSRCILFPSPPPPSCSNVPPILCLTRKVRSALSQDWLFALARRRSCWGGVGRTQMLFYAPSHHCRELGGQKEFSHFWGVFFLVRRKCGKEEPNWYHFFGFFVLYLLLLILLLSLFIFPSHWCFQ